jgi:hypothetical protein
MSKKPSEISESPAYQRSRRAVIDRVIECFEFGIPDRIRTYRVPTAEEGGGMGNVTLYIMPMGMEEFIPVRVECCPKVSHNVNSGQSSRWIWAMSIYRSDENNRIRRKCNSLALEAWQFYIGRHLYFPSKAGGMAVIEKAA